MTAVEIITVFILSLAFLLLIWNIKGFMLKPVVGGKKSCVTVIVTAGSDSKYLEHEIRGLRWLRGDGMLRANILIVDVGMDSETAQIADSLTKNDSTVTLCKPCEIEKIVVRSSSDGGKG